MMILHKDQQIYLSNRGQALKLEKYGIYNEDNY